MPDKVIVVNSTPIIALASIEKLSLLKELYGKIHIPKAVRNEIIAKSGSKAQIALESSQEVPY
jgi:predicted nucleic acid-binding protein